VVRTGCRATAQHWRTLGYRVRSWKQRGLMTPGFTSNSNRKGAWVGARVVGQGLAGVDDCPSTRLLTPLHA
jgi:hypothetical protein